MCSQPNAGEAGRRVTEGIAECERYTDDPATSWYCYVDLADVRALVASHESSVQVVDDRDLRVAAEHLYKAVQDMHRLLGMHPDWSADVGTALDEVGDVLWPDPELRSQ